MNFTAILNAINLAGAAAPAFKALLETVLPLFSDGEQDQLKDAYAAAIERSNAAQERFDDASRGK